MNDTVRHLERSINAGEIIAQRRHDLRRVTVFQPTLVHVAAGEKLLQWGEHTERAGPGQLILLPPGREYGVGNLPGPRGYRADVIQLSSALIADFRQRRRGLGETSATARPAAQLCVPLDAQTEDAWVRLLTAVKAGAPAPLQQHHAEGLLLCLALAGVGGPLLIDRQDPLAARVQQLLLLDPASDWTVQRVAVQLGIGASTLRRQLAVEGTSFRAVLEEVRLGTALQWLQTTRRSVGDIAAECGYASASRFAVRFRVRFGVGPRELRATM